MWSRNYQLSLDKMKLHLNRERSEWLNTLPRKAGDVLASYNELAVSLLPVGVVGKAVCVCVCLCAHWNLGLTPYTHWCSSVVKSKLAAVLLMLTNLAALQWDNDYNRISCFRAQGQEKLTPSMPPAVCVPNPSRTWWETLYIFQELRHAGDLEKFLPARAGGDGFTAWDHRNPPSVLLGFGKWVTLSLSKKEQFHIRCPGTCRKAGEFIWYTALDFVLVKEMIENKFQTEAENVLLFLSEY